MKELDIILEKISARKLTFGKGQMLPQSTMIQCAGVVLTGQVYASFLDYQGRETSVAHIQCGQAFWLAESEAHRITEFTYTAAEKSEILFFEMNSLYQETVLRLPGVSRLLQNIHLLLSDLTVNMSRKISIFSRRTLEEKMIAMLETFGRRVSMQEMVVEMPFNRERMAEYLMADRSALSYCLMKMKKKGMIDYHRNRFVLLYNKIK